MGTTVICSLRFLFLITSIILCSSEADNGGGRGESSRRERHYHVIKGSSLLSEPLACSTSTINTSMQGDLSDPSSLKVVHRQDACSKYDQHLNNQNQETRNFPSQKSQDDFLSLDQIRVNSIQSKVSNNKNNKQLQRKKDYSKSTIPAKSGLPLGIGNYYVKIGFGTPTRDLSLIFDTGSDFTWIQCNPCVSFCHEQEEPIFDPSKSKTYSNISCQTTQCTQVKSATSITPRCSSSSTCIYGIQYGDQSFSVGHLSSDKLTFTPSDVFQNFLFGCGQNNQGLFGKTAGLLGLGRNQFSLISQTAKKYGKVFSYCLPSRLDSIGYLKLGNDAREDTKTSFKLTPLYINSKDPSFYFLDLVSISLGGATLPIRASVFASKGTIIDSGTVITRLPPSAYSVLRSNFRDSMSQYPLTQPTRLFDTCYNLSSYETVSVPKIALNFRGGAILDVGISGILLGRAEQICLAFAGNKDDTDIGIIGNRQQMTYKVLYDVTKKKLGFIPGGCS